MALTLEQLLPHRPPMILVDRIIEANEKFVVTEVTINSQSLFLTEGGVPGWVGIEYMAQTMAAFVGFQAQSEGLPPSIAFLLGVRSYHCQQSYFALGQRLMVTATPVLMDDRIGNFHCKIEISKTIIGQANLTAYKPDKEFLKKLGVRY